MYPSDVNAGHLPHPSTNKAIYFGNIDWFPVILQIPLENVSVLRHVFGLHKTSTKISFMEKDLGETCTKWSSMKQIQCGIMVILQMACLIQLLVLKCFDLRGRNVHIMHFVFEFK